MHAIELALKAFLRAADIPIAAGKTRKHHHITKLYEECKGRGLMIGPDDGSVVALLDRANEEQGFRYFKAKGLTIPELSWTRDVVEALLHAVEPSVNKKAEAHGIVLGRAVKLDITWSKP
jgi:hypothetical protein